MKKYELTSNTIMFNGITLYQIKALKDIPSIGINNGDFGGYIQSESNLSHDGNAWVYGDARVDGNAWVYGDAWVSGDAIATKKVYTSYYKWILTLTDNHIKMGCEQRTIKEWEDYLKGDEVIRTKRDSPEFGLIKLSLELAILQHKLLNEVK